MNFISTFDELNKLYESIDNEKVMEGCDKVKEGWNEEAPLGLGDLYPEARGRGRNPAPNPAPQWWLDKGGTQASWEAAVRDGGNSYRNAWESLDTMTEAADEEEFEISDESTAEDEIPAEEPVAEEAPVEEPVVDDEPRQVICECDKCGALVIKDEADIVVDEETDLVNIADECQFCEEANGFKIVGVVAPYEAEEVPVEADDAADGAEVAEAPTEDNEDEEAEDLLGEELDQEELKQVEDKIDKETSPITRELGHIRRSIDDVKRQVRS